MSIDSCFDRVRNSEKVKEINRRLDNFIGEKVRKQRIALGMTQDKLASFLGVTFQQVQKYEKGVNRISASMLYNIATVLNVKMQWFVEGFENRGGSCTVQDSGEIVYNVDIADTKESQALLRTYYGINDVKVRKKVLDLVKTFSDSTATAKDLESEEMLVTDENSQAQRGKWHEQKQKAKEFRRKFRKQHKES